MTAPGGFELTPRAGSGHAGVGATFCGRRLVHEPNGLEGVDVAVLGAPFDDGTSNRPGARFGPRAIAPRAYLTVDIDVLDPAFAPGTGTPEPGGLTTRELLWAVLHASRELDVCAADIVEVCPPFDNAGVTALAAERLAVEILTGTAAKLVDR
jgi:arginase family enzyme